MQPVGQLDQQHADVVAQREQELAEIFRRALILRLGLDLGELGHPVDQPRDVGAEQFLDLFVGSDGILDRVVEDRGDDRLVVQLEVGEDSRDFDRMAEIGIARGADLGAMRLHREDIGSVEQRLVGVGVICPDLLDQLILPKHDPMWGERAHLRKCEKGPDRGRGAIRPSRGPRVSREPGRLVGVRRDRGRTSRRLGRGIALGEFGLAEGAAVGGKAFEASGALGQPFAQDCRAALLRASKAGRGRCSSS